MKLFFKSLCVVLCLIMIFPVTVFSSFSRYDLNGDASAYTFSLDEGYIPLVVTAGYEADLTAHYSAGGYSCGAVINSAHSQAIITDGRVCLLPCDTRQYYLYFDYNGSMGCVFSNIVADVTVNGKAYHNAVYGINTSSADTEKLVYTDSAHTLTGQLPDGYSVNFSRVNSSDLIIGGVLTGKVTDGEGDFTLYAKQNSSYCSLLKELKSGDTIKISLTESLYAAKNITESGISALSFLGAVIENGTNLTLSNLTLCGYNVKTYKSVWSLLCLLSNGSYMFYVTDGKATLSAVAKDLTEKGCVQAVLLSGDSASLYTEKQDAVSSAYSNVAIGAVNRASLLPSQSTKDALSAAILKVTNQFTLSPDAQLSGSLAYANGIASDPNATENMYKKAISLLEISAPDKTELKSVIEKYSSACFRDYSPEAILALRDAYIQAVSVYENSSATAVHIKEATAKLVNAGENKSVNRAGGIAFNGFGGQTKAGECKIHLYGQVYQNPDCLHILLEYDVEKKYYTVTDISSGNEYTLKSGEILISVHKGDGLNYKTALQVSVGQVLETDGINLSSGRYEIASYLYFVNSETPPVIETPTEPLRRGDVNGNGKIDALDIYILRCVLLDLPVQGVTSDMLLRADCDQNGTLTAIDYMMLRCHFLGISFLKGWGNA